MASLWECAIKCSIGKLVVPHAICRIVTRDYEMLAIEVTHMEAYTSLPLHHRDPFDRLLVAQTRLGGLTLASRGANFPRDGVPTVAA